jgi:hypothetical protein
MTARPDVDALRKALEASTRGAWISEISSEGYIRCVMGNSHEVGWDLEGSCEECFGNMEFIARAHNDLPAILDYIEHLESLCGKAEAVLKYQEYGGFSKEYIATLAQELRAVAGGKEEGE